MCDESTGNPFLGDLSFIEGIEPIQDEFSDVEVYQNSPRYQYSIEFDEPNEIYNSPRPLPDKVTIKKEYW